MEIFCILFLFSFSAISEAGDVRECCTQGYEAGDKVVRLHSSCSGDNIGFKAVSMVEKSTCLTVFTTCCESRANERFCTYGITLAMAALHCSESGVVGENKQKLCCDCCKRGIKVGLEGGSCHVSEHSVMCKDSFRACCNNPPRLNITVATTAAMTKATTAPKLEKTTCNDISCSHSCQEMSSGPKCICRSGYRLGSDQSTCQDVDECAEKTYECDDGYKCKNVAGYYMCIDDGNPKNPCPKGFITGGDGKCVDDDECKAVVNPCKNNQLCLNRNGTYICLLYCPYGFQKDGKICEDINECAINRYTCPRKHTCINTAGSHECKLTSCDEGLELLESQCYDKDECSQNANICRNGQCYNTFGSYVCLCHSGYRKNHASKSCEDRDECREARPCAQQCHNTIGSYRCECRSGFTAIGRRCADQNECRLNPDICGKGGRCYNSHGSYVCLCNSGYKKNSVTKKCEDQDECQASKPCVHECVNTIGSFQCKCPAGYVLNGRSCQDVNECDDTKVKKCQSASQSCFNTHGSYQCIKSTCPSAFYIRKTEYHCALYCPGSNEQCTNQILQSIKWHSFAFRKYVRPRGFFYTYTLRLRTSIAMQRSFYLESGNERGDFFVQRRDIETVEIFNVRKLEGPRNYILLLHADVIYGGRTTNRFVTFFYINVSNYFY